MLYSLGDLIIALCRSEIGEQLEAIRQENPATIHKAEIALLGRPLHIISASMAKHWNLPENLVQLLEKKPTWPDTRLDSSQRVMESIVRAANDLSYCLLNPTGIGQEEVLQDIIKHFLPPFGLTFTQLEQTVSQAFTLVSEISSPIGIDRQHFLPNADPDHGLIQNQQLLLLTQVIRQAIQMEDSIPSEVPEPVQKTEETCSAFPKSDRLLLDFALQAINIAEPSLLLTEATRTLHTSYGFERVWLALVVPGKDKLEGKIGYGPDSEIIQGIFHCSIKQGNFWYRLIHQYQPMRFLSLIQEGTAGGISHEFLQYWGGKPGFDGPLYVPNKPIGLILVDHGPFENPLTDIDFAAFAMVLSQTNANLARLTQHH